MTSTHVCTVCLDPLVRHECPIVATVPCGHSYHEHCLKKWATQRLLTKANAKVQPNITCPICNATVQNVVKLFLSSKNGIDDSLSGEELECWRKEYDVESRALLKATPEPKSKSYAMIVAGVPGAETTTNSTTSTSEKSSGDVKRLQLHAAILESNKKTIDEIFQKQKIMETYENKVKELEVKEGENQRLRHEIFQQIMKHETEMRKMEANKHIITEVLERNEKALQDLKATQEENLDLKRELLKNIMAKQTDIKRLTASKQDLSMAMENTEMALRELKTSREENLSLKKELVEHLHHHKIKMEQMYSHKVSLHEIVVQHTKNINDMATIKKANFELQEELVQTMVARKDDATKLAKCEGWLEVLKEEVTTFEKDRATLRLVRTENCRLGTVVQESHKRWLLARRDLQDRINRSATNKVNLFSALGQVGALGFFIHQWSPGCV